MNKQSLERLKELLEYNPETGKVTIKKSQRTLTADQDGIVVIFDSKAKPKTRKYNFQEVLSQVLVLQGSPLMRCLLDSLLFQRDTVTLF